MYVLSRIFDEIVQFSLSTSFDPSTASFSQLLDVGSRVFFLSGLVFKPDGTEMYIPDSFSDKVLQYSLSTGYDISTASFKQSFGIGTEEDDARGVSLQPDGSRLYVIGINGVEINQYSLSTSYDISTASFTQNLDVSPQDNKPLGMEFNADGSRLYVAGNQNNTIFQYSLSTSYDVSTASLTKSLDVGSDVSAPAGLHFKPDGSRLYVADRSGDNVAQFAVGQLVQALQ
jgi:DNA-binding beta-propeller fold protein YncE